MPFTNEADHDRRRQQSNLAILTALRKQVEQYRMLRFQQILQNLGICNGEDRFYEEPWETSCKRGFSLSGCGHPLWS